MHHYTVTLKPPVPLPIHHRHHHQHVLVTPRVTIGTTKQRSSSTASVFNDWKLRSVVAKSIDVSTLGNLCVDIVLNVPELPPSSPLHLKAYMDTLSSSPPHKKYWEAGGNSNMVIAAARLGLGCAAIGHVGNEIYGRFLIDVLRDEGISMVGMSEDGGDGDNPGDGYSRESYETLLCWVLVDPLQRHGFCSRADFSDEPAFSWMSRLSSEVKMAIANSRILFCNGYGFDELSPGLLVSALCYAIEVGTSVFFDPGPRGKSLSSGTPQQQEALTQFLKMSDVLLLTSDEAETLTGIRHPILAGQELLRNGVRTKWVIVKMGSRGSIVVTASGVSCAPAFKVNVVDTVGCGDSFVAAIAFGFVHNLPLVDTLTIANAVGAATAMGCGAGRNVATLEQVIEIIEASKVNEDDEFWNELVKDLGDLEIEFLSKIVVNGSSNQLKRVSLQKVVSDSSPKLCSTRLEGKLTS